MVRAGKLGALGLAVAALTLAGHVAAQEAAQPPEPLTERHDSFASAISTPAEDLNLKRTPIPEILQSAAINPYDMRALDRCEAIAAQVRGLDEALGVDRDEAPKPDVRTDDEKRESGAASVLRAGVEAVEPYRGIVRRVTGATAYEKKVQEAIEGGFARRGFLKGLAVERNCAPPASPAWFVPSPPTSRPAYARYAPYAPYGQSPRAPTAPVRRYDYGDTPTYTAPYGDAPPRDIRPNGY